MKKEDQLWALFCGCSLVLAMAFVITAIATWM
jgi:hypothetical protein